MLREVGHLIQHEFKLEFKQKQFVSSIVMYIISTIFVCYLTFDKIEDGTMWNGLFWVVILFSLTNAISKSFLNENSSKQLFLYTLINPRALILGKTIYNLCLTVGLVLISFVFFSLLIETNKADLNMPLFLVSCLFGGMSISSTLTMISAIAAKTNNNIGILAILAFPIIMPSILMATRLSSIAMQGGGWGQANDLLILLGTINMMVIALAFLLFPYLWKQ